jgi:nucleotide-binding universal stress UspA family protein
MKKLRILIPTDLSEISNRALNVGGELAKMTNGIVTPLFAYAKTRYDGANNTPEAAKVDVDTVASRYIYHDFLAETIVSLQKPVDAIIDNGKDFDLIIMSSHGRSGFNRILLGSVTEKVIRLSHTPVLVVKDQEKLFPIEKILLTTDFSDNARNTYSYVAKLAELTGASIHMLYAVVYAATEPATHLEAYVRTKEKQFKSDIQQYFGNISDRVTFDIPLTKKSAHEFILNHVDEHKYNLIVMSTLGHTGLEYLKLGSTTSNVVRHTDVNILITNPNSKLD